MKALLFAGLLALPAARSAQAQSWHPKPKARDNLILIQTADSATLALRKLGQVFGAQGFTIDKLDETLLTLTLAPKTLPLSYHPVLYIGARADRSASSNLTLRADYRAASRGIRVGSPAEYVGGESGITKTCFRMLEKAALAYPGGYVSYGRQ